MTSSQPPGQNISVDPSTQAEVIQLRRTLEYLEPAECALLLSSLSIGRLAVSTETGPEIFPVNYGVLDGAIAFWTGEGRKLEHASFNRVAFEVDSFDVATRSGWVVEVRGHAEDISDAADPFSVALRAVPVSPWVTGRHGHCIAITRPQLSGRRLGPTSSDKPAR